MGFWDNDIDRLKVNYDKRSKTNIDLRSAEKVILKCIVEIKGYETNEISRLMK
jgi:hypothetical protein